MTNLLRPCFNIGLCFLVLHLFAFGTAWGQVPTSSYVFYVSGEPITCRASNSQPVPFHTGPAATWIARQHGGGYALFDAQGPRIALDVPRLRSLPPHAALFIVYHECAHLALPMGVGLQSPYQERNADCYAIKAMRNHGALPNYGAFLATLQSLNMGHGLDVNRAQAMFACAAQG